MWVNAVSMPQGKFDIYRVVCHELGHALGLNLNGEFHANKSTPNLMAPAVSGKREPDGPWDVRRAIELYGKSEPEPEPEPDPEPPPGGGNMGFDWDMILEFIKCWMDANKDRRKAMIRFVNSKAEHSKLTEPQLEQLMAAAEQVTA